MKVYLIEENIEMYQWEIRAVTLSAEIACRIKLSFPHLTLRINEKEVIDDIKLSGFLQGGI